MTISALPRFALTLTASLFLAACGGGGGSSDGTGTPVGTTGLDTATLQGRWETPAAATPAYTAIVVPGTSNVATAWLLAEDASRLAKLGLNSALAVSGKTYPLDGSAVADVSGNFAASLDTGTGSVTLTNVLAGAILLNRSSTLAGIAAHADAAGTWKATAGTVVANWALSDTGVISGSSTTGCTYAGNTQTPTSISLYTLSFTETCAGAATDFNGIATLNADRTRLTVAATATGDAKGTALFFVRQ